MYLILFDRASVRACPAFRHRKRRYSTPLRAQRCATHLELAPHLPLLQSIFFFPQPTSKSSRTNLPCANSGLQILSLLLSDDPPVEIPVSANQHDSNTTPLLTPATTLRAERTIVLGLTQPTAIAPRPESCAAACPGSSPSSSCRRCRRCSTTSL